MALLCVTTSCKEEPKLAYKYSDKDPMFLCSEADMDLINEAVYAFEDFILTNYDFALNKELSSVYKNFFNNAEMGLTPMAERADDHLIQIINALRNEKDLWNINEGMYSLNLDSNLLTCLANGIQDESFGRIFETLVSSRTLRTTTIAPLMRQQAFLLKEDKAISTYVALDMFYAKILDIDFSQSKQEVGKIIAERNSSRMGHNH